MIRDQKQNVHFILNYSAHTIMYCIARNFCQEKILPILPPGLVGENFVSRIFCPMLILHRTCGDLYRVGEDRIFLQYKGTWAWQNFVR